VARDPEESGLDTSAFSKSTGVLRNREVTSHDGSHGDGVGYNTWHRVSAFGVLKGERVTTFHMPISR
jgi:hypothetical protein